MELITGIDVSHWQTASSWSVDGTIEFVIARASIGTKVDDVYDNHIAKARAAGLVTGAYHFNWSPLSVSDQVNTFIQRAGNVDLYALDVEDNVDKISGNRTPKFTKAQAAQFISLFHQRTGKKIGLYMSDSIFYDNVGQDWNWVAHWDREPSNRWDIWQYGLYKGEDGNRFDGTVSQLRALGGAGPMAVAINGTTRLLKSSHVRTLKAGAMTYKDTNGTPLREFDTATVVDDFGYPLGEPGWVYIGVKSRGYDSDDDFEFGLALAKLSDLSDIRPKNATELLATAETYADMGSTPAEVQAAIDEATADLTTQNTELSGKLQAVESQVAQLIAERDSAIEAERERLRNVLGIDEPA